ncbi:cell division protein FtsL [Paenibacillus sp. y28]|uniref:cell division protein FtsL n=1 Tax=Paenibacillus sp. y28 TaxID=3129110 RepID=UPI0030181163
MPAYIHGSLAVEERTTQPKRGTAKETIRTVYRRKAIPVQEKLLYLLTVIACVLVAGAIIFRYAQIYEMNSRITSMEEDIKMLQMENNRLKLEIGRRNSPEQLQKEAAKYGLVPMDPKTGKAVTESKSGSAVQGGQQQKTTASEQNKKQ